MFVGTLYHYSALILVSSTFSKHCRKGDAAAKAGHGDNASGNRHHPTHNKKTTTMPEPQMTVEREFAFDSALAHYYQGLSAADAAKTFLNACADALIEAHKNGESLVVPLKFVVSQSPLNTTS